MTKDRNEEDGIESAEFAQLVYNHQNKYIDLADRKASLLLSAHIAYLGLFANMMSRVWETTTVIVKVSSVVTSVSIILVIVCATKAVYPNTPETPQGLILWESITDNSIEEYREKVMDRSNEELEEELVDESYKLAEVASSKYPSVRNAMRFTGIVFFLSIATGILAYFV